ncbi:hypothetical protein CYMTET_34469 [Cymbomonas tetramitiformis]|uniref:TRP C-terminal domain-containing protein n=1 Tax=Cymbomonas tetramitiformis TaxID=36881 RepID=A0AAE0KPU5_9CHLO|nr:hypothetical protein CYMTET_34469 [Cymbomonas tetramitiformis]
MSNSLLMANVANQGGAIRMGAGAVAGLQDCVFQGNSALSGGALSGAEDAEVLLENCTAWENLCDGDGGVVHLSGADTVIELRRTVLSKNAAAKNGGAVFATEGTVNVTERTTFSHNQLAPGIAMQAEEGGALHLGNGASGRIADSDLQHNSALDAGGAAYIDSNARLTVNRTEVVGSVAKTTGGAFQLAHFAVLQLANVKVLDSRASTGAGVHVSGQYADLVITECLFQGGSASEGGAVSMALEEGQRIHVDQAEFASADTLYGGGLYFGSQTSAINFELTGITFEGNHANYSGDCMYWQYEAGFVVPECHNCTCDGEYASSIARSSVQQYDASSGSWYTVDSLESQSTQQLAKHRFTGLDYYGNVVQVSEDGTVVANAVVNHPDDVQYVRGGTLELYTLEGAVFEELVLVGVPGLVYNISWVFISQAAWPTVELPVILMECLPGEKYVVESQSCVICAQGYLKLDNSTEDCSECNKDEVSCLGGNVFMVQPGYWVPTAATACEADTNCLLDLVYECDLNAQDEALACMTEEALRTSTTTNISSLTLCDVGYRPEVALCQGCADGYYMNSSNECISCDIGIGVLFLQFLFFFMCMGSLLYLVWFISLHASKTSMSLYSPGMHLASSANSIASIGSSLFSVVMGHLQVLGPMLQIFQSDIGPPLSSLEYCLLFVNFPVASVLQLSCMGEGPDANGFGSKPFHLETATKAMLPWITCGAFGGLYRWFDHQRKVRAERTGDTRTLIDVLEDETTEEFLLEAKKAACVTTTTFLLIFYYPTVGVQMFQVFFCDPITVEDEDYQQYWLRYDRSAQCFTREWWGLAMIAVFTVLTYIIGFPVAVGMLLNNFYEHKCYLVNKRESMHAREVHLKTNVGRRASILDRKSKRLEGEDVWWASKDGKESTRRRRNSFPPARKLEAEEMAYSPVDKAPIEQKLSHDDVLYRKESEVVRLPNGKLQLEADGKMCTVTEVMRKVEYSPTLFKYVHISKLDDPLTILFYGRFYIFYLPTLYFWNSISMLRRLMQTGLVVVVQIMVPSFATTYALTIGLAAFGAHIYFRPYMAHESDIVEGICLLNIVVTLYVIMTGDAVPDTSWNSRLASSIVFSFHMGLACYLLYISALVIWSTVVDGQDEIKRLKTRAMSLLTSNSQDDAEAQRQATWLSRIFGMCSCCCSSMLNRKTGREEDLSTSRSFRQSKSFRLRNETKDAVSMVASPMYSMTLHDVDREQEEQSLPHDSVAMRSELPHDSVQMDSELPHDSKKGKTDDYTLNPLRLEDVTYKTRPEDHPTEPLLTLPIATGNVSLFPADTAPLTRLARLQSIGTEASSEAGLSEAPSLKSTHLPEPSSSSTKVSTTSVPKLERKSSLKSPAVPPLAKSPTRRLSRVDSGIHKKVEAEKTPAKVRAELKEKLKIKILSGVTKSSPSSKRSIGEQL